jgi:hypothetical protein
MRIHLTLLTITLAIVTILGCSESGFQSGASSSKKDSGDTSKKSKSVPTATNEMGIPDDPEIIATS